MLQLSMIFACELQILHWRALLTMWCLLGSLTGLRSSWQAITSLSIRGLLRG